MGTTVQMKKMDPIDLKVIARERTALANCDFVGEGEILSGALSGAALDSARQNAGTSGEEGARI